jgi:hypothetical protein
MSHPTAFITECAGRRRRSGSSARHLRQLKPEMPFLHEARRRHQARLSRHKHRLGVSMAVRLELAQPSSQHRRDSIERQLRMNA